VYSARFFGHESRLPSRGLLERIATRLGRRPVPQALDDPLRVVARDERADDRARFLEIAELVQVETPHRMRPSIAPGPTSCGGRTRPMFSPVQGAGDGCGSSKPCAARDP